MTHLCVKNWAKYQHYKDRNPPWVKLYLNIIVKYHADGTPNPVRTLGDAAWRLYLSLFCLAPRFDGYIPNDPQYIAAETGADASKLPELLQAGLIAECSKPASVDASRPASKVAPILLDSENRVQRRETEKTPIPPDVGVPDEWKPLQDPEQIAAYLRTLTSADPSALYLSMWHAAIADLADRKADPEAIMRGLKLYAASDPKTRPGFPKARFLDADWFLSIVAKTTQRRCEPGED